MIDQLNEPALTALPDETPVTMLNLMRFRERSLDGNGSGWDAYLRYSKLTIKLIKAQGGTIIWTGDAEAVALGVPERHRWDYVALVRYPSRAAFLAMMNSPEYAAANIERENGCADHAIVAVKRNLQRAEPPTEGIGTCPWQTSWPRPARHPRSAFLPIAQPSWSGRPRICGGPESSTASSRSAARRPRSSSPVTTAGASPRAELLAGGPMVVSFFRGSW